LPINVRQWMAKKQQLRTFPYCNSYYREQPQSDIPCVMSKVAV
jgi:hypothetical protein